MNIFEHVVELEAKFNNKNYDYIIGNSNFYNFLGERHYTTLDSIISSDSLGRLKTLLRSTLTTNRSSSVSAPITVECVK